MERAVAVTRGRTRIVEEAPRHKRLKETVKKVFDQAGLKTDLEVDLNFTGERDEAGRLVSERSIDCAVVATVNHRSILLAFECKSGRKLKEMKPHKEARAWTTDISHLRASRAKVLSSVCRNIKDQDLRHLTDVRICYVLGGEVDAKRYASLTSAFKSAGQYTWGQSALTYYQRTAQALQGAVRYQLLRDLGLNLESDIIRRVPAIRVRQRDAEFYVFAAEPSLLLKIGYVYRRASGQPEAYQRIINGDRLDKIAEFLKSRHALLPNAIILAFDSDPDVQKHVTFHGDELRFSERYCSAWIIDGQHRVYGFTRTAMRRTRKEDSPAAFELPVVAFKSLDLIAQNRTFVSINYNQKKIDPTLLCDLAIAVKDLRNELTWPSMLAALVNGTGPLEGRVKIGESDKARPITISSFARYGLLEGLLGYDRRQQTYSGVLYRCAPFQPAASVESRGNKESLGKQAAILQRFFSGVQQNTTDSAAHQDPWRNTRRYALLGPTGINALLLVLGRIMEVHDLARIDLAAYLAPLKDVDFRRNTVASKGGGWKGFRGLANVMLRRLNKQHGAELRLYGRKDKK